MQFSKHVSMPFLPIFVVLGSVFLAPAGTYTSVLRAQTMTVAAPNTEADIAPTLLTPDILTHYIALKQELLVFWSAPTNKVLRDSAAVGEHALDIELPDGGHDDAAAFNYVDLAAREPAIAAIFEKNSLTPQQYEPIQIAVFQVQLVRLGIEALGQEEAKDWPDTLLKNVALVTTRTQELRAVRVAIPAPDHDEWIDVQSDLAEAQRKKKDEETAGDGDSSLRDSLMTPTTLAGELLIFFVN